ncbi:hypothetical protein ABT336_11850 [Micromonospora sp. NPDC000207]|uniref:hypothetical protein n=1 Tax=Micromonospora sp. NPDC000207 TaxID=3154246 RepID=UPI00333050AF
MRTHYELWLQAAATPGFNKVGDNHTTLESAYTAAGYPNPDDWTWANTDHINRVVKAESRRDDNTWLVAPVKVPDNDADRVALATELALEYGQTDGDHHKTWVIDQMLRALTGDRYPEVIAEYRAGEDGPDTYAWDEGTAP